MELVSLAVAARTDSRYERVIVIAGSVRVNLQSGGLPSPEALICATDNSLLSRKAGTKPVTIGCTQPGCPTTVMILPSAIIK